MTANNPGRDELLFVPLGGTNEIGMNLALYGHAGQWLMVDCGLTFADAELPGVDLVFPDPGFIAERRHALAGLALTHGHEDHLGAVAWLWPRLRCPVYATPFAAALLRRKLAETGLADEVPITVVDPGGSAQLGPFGLRWIGVTHSIPESHALAITTRLGTVLHSGDWKLDPEPLVGPRSDEAALAELGRQGLLALIGDSTNVFTPGRSGSEGDLRRALREIIAARTGRVCVTTFSSNVARVDTVARIAAATDRQLVMSGRSLERTVAVARECGYLRDLPRIVPEEDAGYLPPGKALYLVTGCQGEARGALARIVFGEHRELHLEAGDTVIFSARQIPGNERAIERILDRLSLDGIEAVTWRDAHVHVSGHPARDELADFYRLARPRIAVPVHGEARHLAEHARLARSFGAKETVVPRNGAVVRLAPGPAEIIDWVPVGRLALDGDQVVAIDSQAIRERRRLAWNGAAVIAIALDAAGDVLTAPRFSLFGLYAPEKLDPLKADMVAAVAAAVEGLPRPRRASDGEIGEAVRRALKPFWPEGRRPLVEIQVLRAGARVMRAANDVIEGAQS
ncbi:MAG: ribonuclease J [Alphaproteobacteria bacterium]|nr:ribonuclease J [Alphaproteobacteria bacterium]